ncbi:hydroxyethylthiazole kinase [Dellaglioa sp. P0083]|uniref:hydroxyethylthiazole kinase n=1 Tax=Dellaglioa kimchii TaxID=3344667 RepID=UPI0038D458B1
MPLELLDKLRKENPVIFNISNYITVQDVANGLNAIGASPIMPSAIEEAAEMLQISAAATINMGSFKSSELPYIERVSQIANDLDIPLVLDPVAVAMPYRQKVITNLLEHFHFNFIRGNAGEIAALAGVEWQAKGIDAGNGSADLAEIAKIVAKRYNCTVVLSGPTDYISDGKRVATVTQGTSLFQTHVGSGDMLSSLIAAFAAVSKDNEFEAARIACLIFATTGELVADELITEKPGSFIVNLLDKLHLITINELSNQITMKGDQ